MREAAVAAAPPLHCFCINLDDRPDKWAELQAAFRDTGIIPERFPGVKNSIGWKGCGAAHVGVAAEAARRGLPWVLVLEDDCLPVADFVERWPALKEELWACRGEWHMFLGGPTYIEGPVRRVGGARELIQIERGYALQFYVLQAKGYDAMQAWSADRDGPIDVYTAKTFELITTEHILAAQRPSKSDIRQEDIDYTAEFEDARRTMERLLYSYDTRWATWVLLAIGAALLFVVRRR